MLPSQWDTCVPWHTNIQVAFRHRSDSAANYWHDWNVGIIVGRIAASPINSRTNLSVKPSAEEGAEGFKRDRKPQWTERRSLGPAESCRSPDIRTLPASLFQLLIALSRGRNVCGWSDLDSVQKERPSHSDLLECFLQLRTLHRLPGTYYSGLAVSDKLNAEPDHMGVFLPAVLLADWQLGWRRLQKNVSISQILRSFFFFYPGLIIWENPAFKRASPSTFRLFSALSALFVSALIISVIFAIIPLCNNVLVLAIAMAVSGLAMGIIDTIANIQLVTIYQKDSAVFLQVTKKRFFLHNTAEIHAFALCRLFTSSSALAPWWARWLPIPSCQSRAVGITRATAPSWFTTSETCSETAPSCSTTSPRATPPPSRRGRTPTCTMLSGSWPWST